MSAEATKYLQAIRAQYEAAGLPAHEKWYFDAGATNHSLEELETLGLVFKVLGTERGFAWRLSNTGAELVQCSVAGGPT
jgi:hypothetical protein